MAALFRSVKGKGAKTGAAGSITVADCVYGYNTILGGFSVFPLSQVELSPPATCGCGADHRTRPFRGKVRALHQTAPTRRRSDTLDHVQTMPGQLRFVAERCSMFTDLIEMAYVEAGDGIRGESSPLVGRNKRNTSA